MGADVGATGLGALRPGDHICWMFDDDRLRLDAAEEVVRAGITDHHKIVYCTWALLPDMVLAGLTARGVDTSGLLRTGQLEVTTAAQLYLTDGRFDAEASTDGWAAACRRARADGYLGLRAIGDMSWAGTDDDPLDCGPGAAHEPPGAVLPALAAYEAAVNRLFVDGFAMSVCQYDMRRFAQADLGAVQCAHPAMLGVGCSGRTTPLLRIHRDGLRLQLAGESDLSNRDAVRACLQDLCTDAVATGRPIILDVTALRFADPATADMFLHAAAQTPAGATIIGCNKHLRWMLDLLGSHPAPPRR